MSSSRFPTWQEIRSEYMAARHQLEQLLKEGDDIRINAEELIIRLDQHYHRLEAAVKESVPLEYALTSPLPPAIDRKKVKGIVAFRAWNMQVKGALSPSIVWQEDTWRSEVAFADKMPSMHNSSGLHATRIEYWKTNHYDDFVSGLVDCYGKVVEHRDGVLRAECASILMIMLTLTDKSQAVALLTGTYEALCWRYPNVPVYVVSPYQKELIVMREVLKGYGAI